MYKIIFAPKRTFRCCST